MTAKTNIKKTITNNKTKNKVILPLSTIFNRDIKSLKSKDVKRGMSKLIQLYCKKEATTEDAKTLTYMFSTYIQIITQLEIEERLRILEGKII